MDTVDKKSKKKDKRIETRQKMGPYSTRSARIKEEIRERASEKTSNQKKS